jgi:hypothetical protein
MNLNAHATARRVMLYTFGFDRVGVLVSDLYIVVENPQPGQEGAEHGVRLEVRLLERGELRGSPYSARPIEVGAPVWRADLLETVDGPPGSFDRTHHHPVFTGWEPGGRVFDEHLKDDPVQFVAAELTDLEGLLERSGRADDKEAAADADSLRRSVPEIMQTVERMLAKVRGGELAAAPGGDPLVPVRESWL